MKSFDCSSPSELDRKFFGDQSLPPALLLEQSRGSSDDTVADDSDARLSLLTSLCLSSDPNSPSLMFSLHKLNNQEAAACHLAVPLQGKSSTPHVLLGKQMKSAGFDRLNGDMTASQMSWDVSLIKSENSPKPCLESSALEATWSPKLQSTQAEVSP